MASFGTVRKVNGPHLVKWECVVKKKDNGGLCICLVARKILSLLAKWSLDSLRKHQLYGLELSKARTIYARMGGILRTLSLLLSWPLESVCQCLFLFFSPFYGW